MKHDEPMGMHRREAAWLGRVLRRAFVAMMALTVWALAGCGFRLSENQPMAFKTVQLTGFASNSPTAAELARALEASGVQVVDSSLAAAQAASSGTVPSSHIVLEGLVDQRDMVVATLTAYGQVRDMTARNTLRFQVKRSDGSILLPPTDVGLAHPMTYNEKDALAKQDESEALHRAMQTDIVQQVMRRLAAIRPQQLVNTTPESTPQGPVYASSQPQAAGSPVKGIGTGR